MVGAILAAAVGWPSIPGWLGQLLPARAALQAGEPRPAPSPEATSRLLPPARSADLTGSRRYAFIASQENGSGPVTFDPCRPVAFVVRADPALGPAAHSVVADAAEEVSAASGLQLVDHGSTDEAPSRRRAAYQPERYGDRWAPVLVAWSDPSEEPRLDGRVAGIGGGYPVRDTHGHLTYVSGAVALDTPALAPLLGTPSGRLEVRAIVMHELAHVLGAHHVEADGELMQAENTGQLSFGAGDRYGLSVLGKGECVPGL